MESERITLIGAPPSPYTRKMISLLRYRHINYEIIWGDPGTILDSGEIFTKFNIENQNQPYCQHLFFQIKMEKWRQLLTLRQL